VGVGDCEQLFVDGSVSIANEMVVLRVNLVTKNHKPKLTGVGTIRTVQDFNEPIFGAMIEKPRGKEFVPVRWRDLVILTMTG
jgi:hypothetical protein